MIFYFSSTGNSKWAAGEVAKALGSDERLIFIPDAIRSKEFSYSLQPDERLGFIFPVHGWRPSIIVRRFVRALKLEGYLPGSTYTYMLVTAGDTIGRTAEIFTKDLAKKGVSLDAAFSLLMPESYIGLPGFNLDTPAREKQKIYTAAQKIKEYIEYISERRRGVVSTVKGSSPWLYSGPVGAAFLHWIISDRKFTVDTSLCVKCGLCASVCPVDDIDGGPGKSPVWKHNGKCLSCFSCYHHCPKNAIQYGRATQGKGQYFYGHGR